MSVESVDNHGVFTGHLKVGVGEVGESRTDYGFSEGLFVFYSEQQERIQESFGIRIY